MSEKKKDRTIFRVLVLPLISILAVEMFVLAASLLFGGVMKKLNQNAKDMVSQQVENRGNYLLNDMIGNWSNLDLISKEINSVVQEKLDSGEITLEELYEKGGGSDEILKVLCPELIQTMRNKQVSGIFMILNTQELSGDGPDSLQGIYLRDLDPTSTPSQRNEDVLTERAPVEVVRSGWIATDTGWQPSFSREDGVENPMFYQPFSAAYEDGGKLAAKEYGYWSAVPYTLSGDKRLAISYSQPLILEDGTVYGVLGVELLEDYMQSQLPCGELMENESGSYFLAVSKEGDNSLFPVILSSESMTMESLKDLHFSLEEDGREAFDDTGQYFGAVKPLVVYRNNAPFESDNWYLLGIGAKKNLYAFSRQIRAMMVLSFALTLIIGLLGILLVSYQLSKPIRHLSHEVEQAKKSSLLPNLPDTGIREIDQFADAIVMLQQEVMDSSTRFLQIINMASVDIGGYEVKDGAGSVFVTGNYFPMLGMEDVDVENMTPETFWEKLECAKRSLESTSSEEGGIVYKVPLDENRMRYVRFEDMKEGSRHVGLVEDVTTSTLERMRVERERDCDGLTKLYSRRGFRRVADALFLNPDKLKQAGLLMIDLDNLKSTNDTYGHNFGDMYIQTAAKCFSENTPENTLCARISGDEFLILFYGYNSFVEIWEKLEELYRAIGKVEFHFPDGSSMGLSASGGVAWYPKDSRDLSDLMKYADFAMYQVKCSKKGEFKEFDDSAYQQKVLKNQIRMEFNQMLEGELINYHFQPIFHSRSGEVFAYEALMRVDFPMLRSPETVLNIAREEGRMHDIERLTMFRASQCYCDLLKKGKVSKKALLFLNSIANESMTKEEGQKYHEAFSHIQKRVVVEITEAEHLDMDLINSKRETEGFSGMFALDDYGSGYNSEINLLELKPEFVKVDITIVRDIDSDVNKQQIVSNMVIYAHKRNMMVIAEGLETPEEVQKCLELRVDLLQGYFLARPGEVPPAINPQASQMIKEYWKNHPAKG